jgi:hypothetical protein
VRSQVHGGKDLGIRGHFWTWFTSVRLLVTQNACPSALRSTILAVLVILLREASGAVQPLLCGACGGELFSEKIVLKAYGCLCRRFGVRYVLCHIEFVVLAVGEGTEFWHKPTARATARRFPDDPATR